MYPYPFTRFERIMNELSHRQQGRCFDCGNDRLPLTKGHLIPKAVGGSNHIANLVGQCKPCNNKQAANVHPAVVDHFTFDGKLVPTALRIWKKPGVGVE